jgi:hypothetical protein
VIDSLDHGKAGLGAGAILNLEFEIWNFEWLLPEEQNYE